MCDQVKAAMLYLHFIKRTYLLPDSSTGLGVRKIIYRQIHRRHNEILSGNPLEHSSEIVFHTAGTGLEH